MSRRRVLLRGGLAAALLLLLIAGLSLLHPRVQYVLTAAGYQLEVLWGRVPVEQAIEAGQLTPEQIERARLVPGIKAHARSLGLADTGHYSTITPTWDTTVYNVSGCQELSFSPRTWWFPIVGRVPYLGFFDEQAANAQADAMREQGLDVYVRTAGAWSTLGWFEDPLLPHMLSWSEAQLANTLFHELTHATVWIPGSVRFNESLASFVGQEASLDYLQTRYGPDSEQVQAELDRRADRDVYLQLMHDVYQALDEVYTSTELSEQDKRSRKQAILGALPERARRAGFSDPERWASWMEEQPWNNARLVQFRVYNESPDQFGAILERTGDLRSFLDEIEHIAAGADDPYQALEEAAAR